uniref:Putative secreted protein n=1 Tax=Anopheles marajoara TaxID=58244 RepID=A0A2M4C785_9DIPT
MLWRGWRNEGAALASMILITTAACSKPYVNCGFSSNMVRASTGSFCRHTLACRIISYIWSGCKRVTILAMMSGVSCGLHSSPYGFSTCGPCNSAAISMRDFSVHALSTRSARPPNSYPFRFRIALWAVSWSLYSQNP